MYAIKGEEINMKKSLKILFVLPAFMLCACDNSKEVNAADAKAQVASMREEVAKDSFTVPNKGMTTSNISIKSGETTTNTVADIRFDTTTGNRYFYTKGTLMGVTAENWYYEKDGKYFSATKAMGITQSTEYQTEAEFKTVFDAALGTSSYDQEGLKKDIDNTLSAIDMLYTEIDRQSSSGEVVYDYNVSFTKINDSSFKLVVTASSGDSTAGYSNIEETIEFANYLPTKVYTKLSGSDEETVSDLTFTWGSVDYIYPSK